LEAAFDVHVRAVVFAFLIRRIRQPCFADEYGSGGAADHVDRG